MNISNNPIIFFDSVIHFGGAIKSSLALIEEINKTENIIVLDDCGYCREYIAELKKKNIEFKIVNENFKNPIIGNHCLKRYFRMLCVSPRLFQTIIKLRKILLDLNPKAIWLNSERSMFSVSRAVGKKFPTLLFIRGQHPKLKWYCKKDWKKLSLILGNNNESLNYFRKFRWSKDKLGTVYNGIDISKTQDTPELKDGLPGLDANFKIIMPATLIPLKNHSMAIKAFCEFQKIHSNSVLWICGDTPNRLPPDYENSLHKLCKDLGVFQKVCFLGWRSDVPAIMKKADMLILTSFTEGFPRSILEAMVLQLPVISTSVGGVPEVIENQRDGLLVPINDVKALTKAMLSLTEESFRKMIVKNAFEMVKQKFTVQNQSEIFLRYISGIRKNG